MRTTRSTQRTAFLGIGLMGAQLAGRLLEGSDLRAVWNRDATKTADLQARGATVAPTPIAAATGVDVLALCLTDGVAVTETMFGPDGPASLGGSAPRMVLDFTTSTPSESQAFARRYAELTGGDWIDAPVSGGIARAAAGTLTIFCGGTKSAFERALPLLDLLASRATLVGSHGAGQTLKLVAQLIAAPTIAAIGEALAAAEANGLDPASVPDLLTGGLADSPLLQLFGRNMVSKGGPRSGTIATMYKDIAAATRMAQTAGTSAPVADATAEVYRELSASGAHEIDYLFTCRRRPADG